MLSHKMYILAPQMYILSHKMYILAPQMYILAPKWTEVYLLKRYSPSDSFCTFFSESEVKKIKLFSCMRLLPFTRFQNLLSWQHNIWDNVLHNLRRKQSSSLISFLK